MCSGSAAVLAVFTVLFNILGGTFSSVLGLSIPLSFVLSLTVSVPASILVVVRVPTLVRCIGDVLVRLHMGDEVFVLMALSFNIVGSVCILALGMTLVISMVLSILAAFIGGVLMFVLSPRRYISD